MTREDQNRAFRAFIFIKGQTGPALCFLPFREDETAKRDGKSDMSFKKSSGVG